MYRLLTMIIAAAALSGCFSRSPNEAVIYDVKGNNQKHYKALRKEDTRIDVYYLSKDQFSDIVSAKTTNLEIRDLKGVLKVSESEFSYPSYLEATKELVSAYNDKLDSSEGKYKEFYDSMLAQHNGEMTSLNQELSERTALVDAYDAKLRPIQETMDKAEKDQNDALKEIATLKLSIVGKVNDFILSKNIAIKKLDSYGFSRNVYHRKVDSWKGNCSGKYFEFENERVKEGDKFVCYSISFSNEIKKVDGADSLASEIKPELLKIEALEKIQGDNHILYYQAKRDLGKAKVIAENHFGVRGELTKAVSKTKQSISLSKRQFNARVDKDVFVRDYTKKEYDMLLSANELDFHHKLEQAFQSDNAKVETIEPGRRGILGNPFTLKYEDNDYAVVHVHKVNRTFGDHIIVLDMTEDLSDSDKREQIQINIDDMGHLSSPLLHVKHNMPIERG